MFHLLKKLRDIAAQKSEQYVNDRIAKLNAPLDKQKVQPFLMDNMAIAEELFADMDIVQMKTVQSKDDPSLRFFLVYCSVTVDHTLISEHVVKPLMKHSSPEIKDMDELLSSVIQVDKSESTDSFEKIVENVMSGNTAVFAEGMSEAAILKTEKVMLRQIEEPDNEKVLSGPKEGFTEDLMQNLSQIVRRAHTNELKTKILTLGRRTKTKVCVCYFDSLADKNVLSQLYQRLNKINIDGILDSNYITELIHDNPYSPFRNIGNTERPDVVVGKLLEGRIAIIVDGTPMVLTVPYLFIENFQSNEDYYFNFYYSTFTRLLRMVAFFLTITAPGLFISVVAFHQEMLPLELLMRIALERQSVPLPAAVEAVIMLLVFDILRETGVRMPANIGQTLSIVGVLVIGEAAVQARLVAAPMIIVVAFTGITSLLVPRLNAPIIILRFMLLFMSSAFGFLGLTVGLALVAIHVCNLTSFGVQQVALPGTFRLQDIKDILIRMPIPTMIERPRDMTANRTRQTGGYENG